MADKRWSELTDTAPQDSDGVALQRGSSNFRWTFEALRTWLGNYFATDSDLDGHVQSPNPHSGSVGTPMTQDLDSGGFYFRLNDGSDIVGTVGAIDGVAFLSGSLDPNDPEGSLAGEAVLAGIEARVRGRDGKVRLISDGGSGGPAEVSLGLKIDPKVDPAQVAVTAFAYIDQITGKNAFGTFDDPFDAEQNWLYERGSRVLTDARPPTALQVGAVEESGENVTASPLKMAVVNTLPITPDGDTVYFVKA